MSLKARVSSVSKALAAIGAIAVTLVTLPGCGVETVTASSAREPGISVAGPGASRADEPTRTTTAARLPAEPAVAERSSSRYRDHHSVRRQVS